MTPSSLIKSIRESFEGSDIVYTEGACWQFHKILKTAFPEATPWYDRVDGHIYTEIDEMLYDIQGCHGYLENRSRLEPVPNPDLSIKECEKWSYTVTRKPA